MAEKEEQSFTDILKGNIGVLIWTRIILFFPVRMYRPYFSLFIKELGGSPETIGYVQSLASFTSLIIVPIGGYLADFYGRVKLIASAFYFRSVAFLIYIFSGSWSSLAFGKFYEGLTIYHSAAQSAIVADSVRPGRRGIGFAIFDTLPNILLMVAPAVGAYTITQFGLESGMRYLFVVGFFCMFLVGISRQKFLKETLRRDRSEQRASHKGALSLIKEAYARSWEALKWTPKNLLVFVLMELISSCTGAMIGPFWVVYATDVIHLTVSEWGLILFIESLLGLLLAIPAGIIIDKLGTRRIIVLTLFTSLLLMILFTYCRTFPQTIAVLLCLTIVVTFLTPASKAWLANMVPRELRARITSAYGRGGIGVRGGLGGGESGYVISIPTMLGSLAGGFIYSFNPAYPWLIHAASLCLCLLLSALFLREPETPEI